MQAKRRYQHGTAVPVVARMVDVLKPQRRTDSSPHMQGVVALDNVFPAVGQPAVPQKKARSTQLQILLVVARNPVRNKNNSGAIEFSVPPPAAGASSELHRLIHLGVRKRFMPAFIPAPSAENTHPGIQWLFEIHAKSVFEGSTERMSRDVWFGCQTRQKKIKCLTVAPHVGVIDESQKTDNAFLMPHHRPMQFKLEVFRVRAAQV